MSSHVVDVWYWVGKRHIQETYFGLFQVITGLLLSRGAKISNCTLK